MCFSHFDYNIFSAQDNPTEALAPAVRRLVPVAGNLLLESDS